MTLNIKNTIDKNSDGWEKITQKELKQITNSKEWRELLKESLESLNKEQKLKIINWIEDFLNWKETDSNSPKEDIFAFQILNKLLTWEWEITWIYKIETKKDNKEIKKNDSDVQKKFESLWISKEWYNLLKDVWFNMNKEYNDIISYKDYENYENYKKEIIERFKDEIDKIKHNIKIAKNYNINLSKDDYNKLLETKLDSLWDRFEYIKILWTFISSDWYYKIKDASASIRGNHDKLHKLFNYDVKITQLTDKYILEKIVNKNKNKFDILKEKWIPGDIWLNLVLNNFPIEKYKDKLTKNNIYLITILYNRKNIWLNKIYSIDDMFDVIEKLYGPYKIKIEDFSTIEDNYKFFKKIPSYIVKHFKIIFPWSNIFNLSDVFNMQIFKNDIILNGKQINKNNLTEKNIFDFYKQIKNIYDNSSIEDITNALYYVKNINIIIDFKTEFPEAELFEVIYLTKDNWPDKIIFENETIYKNNLKIENVFEAYKQIHKIYPNTSIKDIKYALIYMKDINKIKEYKKDYKTLFDVIKLYNKKYWHEVYSIQNQDIQNQDIQYLMNKQEITTKYFNEKIWPIIYEWEIKIINGKKIVNYEWKEIEDFKKEFIKDILSIDHLKDYLDYFNKNNTELNILWKKIELKNNINFIHDIAEYLKLNNILFSKNTIWSIVKSYEKDLNRFLEIPQENNNILVSLQVDPYTWWDYNWAFAWEKAALYDTFKKAKKIDLSVTSKENNRNPYEIAKKLKEILEDNPKKNIVFYIWVHWSPDWTADYEWWTLSKNFFKKISYLSKKYPNFKSYIDSCYSWYKYDENKNNWNIVYNSLKEVSTDKSTKVFENNKNKIDLNKDGKASLKEVSVTEMMYYNDSLIWFNIFHNFIRNKWKLHKLPSSMANKELLNKKN